MTVANQSRRHDSVSNGSNPTFTYDFELFSTHDLSVYVDGALQVEGIDYNVDSIGPTGGTFTFIVSVPANLAIITAIGNNIYEQATEYQTNEDVAPTRIMKDLDKLVFLLQQIREKQNRSLILALKSQLSGIVVDDPTTVDKFLRVKSLSPLELDWATLVTSGVIALPLSALNGGTGLDGHLAGNGFMLIGNGAGFTLARMTAGANIGLTFSAGGVQIANTYTPPTPPISTGMYGSRGNKSKNNGATPTTKFDLIADLVQCWKPSDNSFLVKSAPGTLTIDFGAAGPIALGRDQAAAFGAGNFVYLYWIMKADGTISATASLTAPPTGPVLPSGYIAWAPCNAVRWDGSSHIIPCHMVGNWTWYDGKQNVVNGGVASVETTVNVATFVPSSAYTFNIGGTVGNNSGGAIVLTLRFISTVDWRTMNVATTGAIVAGMTADIPNVGQQFFYQWSAGAAIGFTADVEGFEMSSGAI